MGFVMRRVLGGWASVRVERALVSTVVVCAIGAGCKKAAFEQASAQSGDPVPAGFRCVDPRADPCRGIDGVGACDGRTALTCIAGALETTLCNACESCRLDGRTGAPYCKSAE